MKKYSRDSIIETVKNLLTYHSDDINCLAFAELLLNKINKVDELFLSSNEISKFLGGFCGFSGLCGFAGKKNFI